MPKAPPLVQPTTWNPPPPNPGGGQGGSGSAVAFAQQQQAIAIASSSGLFVVTFGLVNLAVSQSGLQLHRVIPAAAPVGAQLPIRTTFRGYVAALSLTASEPKSAGVATFEVFLGGVQTDAELVWGNNDGQIAVFEQGKFGFLSDQELDVRVTTDGSFAPTTVDVIADLYLVATNEATTA